MPLPDLNLKFMQEPCLYLDQYLQKYILPDINEFKLLMSKFVFKSPLNFIMIDEDFHEFYKTFYHAKTLIQYATNFITDRSFSLHNLHTNSKFQGDHLQRVDKAAKMTAIISMRQSFNKEKTKANLML